MKQTVINAATTNDNISFYWSLITQDIDDEEASLELLGEVIQLWINIRGFSLAAHWLEVYKAAQKTAVSKSTGLRKGLS